jgi:uncharacterized protein YabN with tetrapyrrole methylase and pyrophosphatase domain
VHAKLVRRHPHVFGDADAASAGAVRLRWEAIKSEQEGREGIFHEIPESLPALLQARKAQRRAAAVGYDWPDLEGPLAKLREELAELEQTGRSAVTRSGEQEFWSGADRFPDLYVGEEAEAVAAYVAKAVGQTGQGQ